MALIEFLEQSMVDRQARKRIQALEERAVQLDCEVAELSARLSRGPADFARLGAGAQARLILVRPHPRRFPSVLATISEREAK
jgi:hypothetical protein